MDEQTSDEANPRITVVTVVYNAAEALEKTVASVVAQTYPNLEYVIVDGGSTDGTLDVIRRYESHIAHWITKPDRGIYDAMNKGVRLATGDWINFLNAGDFFPSPDVCERVAARLDDGAPCFYGSVALDRAEVRDEVSYPSRVLRRSFLLPVSDGQSSGDLLVQSCRAPRYVGLVAEAA